MTDISNLKTLDKAQQFFPSADGFFIGANDVLDKGVWGWEDGSGQLKYANWALGEPKSQIGLDCAVVSLKYGSWSAANCLEKRPFVCAIAPISSACPPPPVCPSPPDLRYCDDGWTIFGKYCFKATPGVTYSFDSANDVCHSWDAELSSIHSKEENEFVQG